MRRSCHVEGKNARQNHDGDCTSRRGMNSACTVFHPQGLRLPGQVVRTR